MPPAARVDFLRDLGSAEAASRAGVLDHASSRANSSWGLWTSFCRSLNQDPRLSAAPDPILLLQVFAERIRTGALTRGNPVGAGTVATRLRDVGQTLALLGAQDPRLTPAGNLDLRLRRQFGRYDRADPPPVRAPPLPVSVLQYIVQRTFSAASPAPSVVAATDMLILGYYFLMRPGEYCHTSTAHPFRFRDVALYAGNDRLNLLSTPAAQLSAATHVLLTFTTQKNGNRGERIGQGRSSDPFFCPVKAAARRIIHLRTHNADHASPLHLFFNYPGANPQPVTSTAITTMLRHAVSMVRPPYLSPEAVTARSLRASGATALLTARVDANLIRLLGRWQSDAMLRYLHAQSAAIHHNLAEAMLQPEQPPTAATPHANFAIH